MTDNQQSWQLDTSSKKYQKQLRKLDKPVQQQIATTLEVIRASGDPMAVGKAMKREWAGYWRYRIDDYRVIVEIKEDTLVIVAIKVGHRRNVYKSN